MQITKSAYARSIGVTPQYINEQLVLNPGCIDLEDCGTKMKVNNEGPNSIEFFNNHYNSNTAIPLPEPKPKKIRKTRAPKPEKSPEVKTVKVKPTKPNTATEPKRPPGNPTGNNGTPNQADHQELKRQKLKEDIEKVRIDNEKKRGALLPKRLIKLAFGRLHSIDENQFKTLGVSAAPEISDVYNDENEKKIKEILELFGKGGDKGVKKNVAKILNAGEEARMLKVTNVLEDKTSKILKSIKRVFDDFLKNIERLKE